jgi:hypothetical protein
MVFQGTPSQQALAVAVEPLAAGRRVAVFGDSSAGLDAILLDQGARAISVFDPDGARALAAADRAAPGVTVQAYGDDDPRPVDVVIVADLGIFADPAELVARARRMVGEYGVAVFAATNADWPALGPAETEGTPDRSRAFDYYDLFDLVANEFHAVRMVVRLPFHGVALMELGEDEDDEEAAGVNVDTRLAEGGRTPEGFVAIASQGTDARLPPYSIVELPSDAPPDANVRAAPDEAMVAALADAHVRVEALAGQLEETSARAAHAEGALHDLRLLQEQAVERAKRTAASDALEEYARAAEGHALELGRLEDGLQERARAIRALESELARRDQMVRDLVSALDDAGSEPRLPPEPIEPVAARPDPVAEANAEALVAMRSRLDALALELARREGEAHASAWKIDELERKVAQTADARDAVEAPRPEPIEPVAAGSVALDQIDALRQALVQEHDARVRAESGEELVRLRAEIARQAALLDKLAAGEAKEAKATKGEATGETKQEVSR